VKMVLIPDKGSVFLSFNLGSTLFFSTIFGFNIGEFSFIQLLLLKDYYIKKILLILYSYTSEKKKIYQHV
jgi:hypothetical protein